MKTLFLVAALTLSFFYSSTAQTSIAALNKAMSDGDAVTIGGYFDQTVELTLLDKLNVLDKKAAITALNYFFVKNKPRAFNEVHQGASKGSASHYSIGDLATVPSTYRVYLYYKVVNEKPVIQEMRIEK
jgi:hypothetical protein